MQQLTDSLIVEFVEKFLAEQAKIETELDWTPPEPPSMPPSYGDNSLSWRPSNLHYDNSPKITIEQLRRELPERLIEYISAPLKQDQPMLLTLVSAGGGKTHAGVLAAQWAAKNGHRVLWCAPNHALFDELALLKDQEGNPIFDPSLWLHFQSITTQEYCRYSQSQQAWLKRGYPAFNLCQQLCGLDQWIRECPYRCQARSKRPIVFGQHQHLATGLMLSDFDVVIIDELPLNAFVDRRFIPTDGLNVGADGRIGQLTDMLTLISKACQKNEFYSGRKLFDVIGPLLNDVYLEVKAKKDSPVVIPFVKNQFDIENQPYWYLMDFLFLTLREHKAWEMQWPNWAERIKISSHGLHLLDRKEPWSKLPQKTIVLDATAEPALYSQVFGKYEEREEKIEVEIFDQDGQRIEKRKTTSQVWEPRKINLYQPKIDRKGRLHLIVGRMNGKKTMFTNEQYKEQPVKPEEYEPSKIAQELLGQAIMVSKKYEGRVCAVSHLATEPYFAQHFGAENMAHFGNIRGSNKLEDSVCHLVLGTPAPSPFDVIDTAVALDRERIEPFVYLEHMKSSYVEREIEYRITQELKKRMEGQGPYRRVRGYWDDWQLQAIHEQMSKAELEQAIHRSRINAREVDVFVFSALPTNEEADWIGDAAPAPAPFTAPEWALIEPWLNARWKEGRGVGRSDLEALLGISHNWVRDRKLLQAIAIIQAGQWLWEDDPEFANRRGPVVQRLKPVELS